MNISERGVQIEQQNGYGSLGHDVRMEKMATENPKKVECKHGTDRYQQKA